MPVIRVQEAEFDLAAEMAALRAGRPQIGAVASFVGIVRERSHGAGVSEMLLEHYPGMTEKALVRIVAAAMARWDLIDARVIHRIGWLKPEDPVVLVAVAARHRGEAFAACECIMDCLKSEAPFWKKERTEAGARWVAARAADDQARARWNRTTDPVGVADSFSGQDAAF